MIGVVLPGGSAYFDAIRKGVNASAAANGFRVRFGRGSEDGRRTEASVTRLTAEGAVDALLVVGAPNPRLAQAIGLAVARKIETATVAVDVPASKRTFFYGPDAAAEGRAQAQRLLATLHAAKRRGEVGYVVTSCLPRAAQQQERRTGFEAAMRANPYKKEFTVKRLGFYATSPNPLKNRAIIRRVLAKQPGVDAVYAVCGPDTLNWGVALREKKKRILVAGHDWTPAIFSLIGQGWVTWSAVQSPYDMGLSATRILFRHESANAPLPKGLVPAKLAFAAKTNLAQIKASPDYGT